MQISISRLRAYQLCPQKYRFRYVEDAEPEFISSNLLFGSAMHFAIAAYHKSMNAIDAEEMNAQFLKYWHAQKTECQRTEKPLRLKGLEQELIDKAQVLCGEYVATFAEVTPDSTDDVELLFEVPLLDPESGIGTLTHSLTGKIDLVANRSLYEFKTSGRTVSQREADTSIQLTAYALAFSYLYDRLPDNLYLVSLVKTKTPKIAIQQTHRESQQFMELVEMGEAIAKAIENAIFYRNREYLYGCSNCEYYNACLGTAAVSQRGAALSVEGDRSQ